MNRPGFTLLEMLISVAIFSGLVILILSIFVRTASSQAKVNVLREKSEVARSVISRIRNDFQYVYYGREVFVLNRFNDGDMSGFHVEPNTVAFLLRYPNKGENDLVFKQYRVRSGNAASRSYDLEFEEFRGCAVQPNGQLHLENDCRDASNTNGYRSVLPDNFLLDYRNLQPVFSGISPDPDTTVTGYLKLAMNFKPAEFDLLNCGTASVPLGTCYKVETILTAGGIN